MKVSIFVSDTKGRKATKGKGKTAKTAKAVKTASPKKNTVKKETPEQAKARKKYWAEKNGKEKAPTPEPPKPTTEEKLMYRTHYVMKDHNGKEVRYQGQLRKTREEAEADKKYWSQFAEYTGTTEEKPTAKK